jgi:hypothetical protein
MGTADSFRFIPLTIIPLPPPAFPTVRVSSLAKAAFHG